MTGAADAARANHKVPKPKWQRRAIRPDFFWRLDFWRLGFAGMAGLHPPILKLALTLNTALTIAKAMKPTKIKTAISTPLAITFVNMLS